MKQWQSKRRLSTTFKSFDNELKTKVNAIYTYLGGDDQILPEDRGIAKIYNDLLDCRLRGTKYIMTKEALGLELAQAQRELFDRPCEMEEIPIMVLITRWSWMLIKLYVKRRPVPWTPG